MAEFKLGRLKFVWRGDWTNSHAYVKDDVVKYGGRVYVCVAGHTSDTDANQGFYDDLAASRWELMNDGQEWRGNWAATTAYNVNDIVKYGGVVYICNTNHVSAALLETDQSKWDVYNNSLDWKGTYATATIYKVNDLVKYGSNIYICTVAHTSTSSVIDHTKFNLFVSGLEFEDSWNSTTAYQSGDIVTYGGYSYVASSGGTNQTPSPTSSFWDILTTGYNNRGVYSGATAYKTGDVVRYGGNTFECILDSTGNSPSNATYWKLMAEGFKWTASWVNATFYKINDVVSYGSSSYICIQEHTANNATNRPDVDITNVYWNVLAEGDSNYVLTTRGDLLTRSAAANVRLAIGTNGQILRSNGLDATWAYYGINPNVYYVAKNGTNAAGYGSSMDRPFLTIAYALQNVVAPAAVFIKAGTYAEVLPMTVPAEVSLIGDELRQTIVEPAVGYSSSNMFHMMNGTGLRNMTLRGLTGTLGPSLPSGTQRPTGGAYVSLAAGTGPADTSVWITNKSPYMQNVTTFGTGAVGMKIDGSLHNGGYKSMVANDFTQVISDGIGIWVFNGARAELVSVFTYYAYMGYLTELGGTIRATNGNNSYGIYGSVSEGVDPTETPQVCNVDNNNNETQVDNVLVGGGQVLRLEIIYAGESYTTASVGVAGNGAGASITPVFANGGVNYVKVLTGGTGYFSTTNNAQSGDTTAIRLATADTEVTGGYNGMRITIVDGTGYGQTGIISAYNGGTKQATIVDEAGNPGWTSIQGAAIAASLDSTTRYTIEPRVQVSGGGTPSRTAVLRAVVEAGRISTMRILDSGAGYTSSPSIVVTDPHVVTTATFTSTYANGVISYFTYTSRGSGYTTALATVAGDGFAAIEQVGGYVDIKNLASVPKAGSNLIFGGLTGVYRLVSINNLSGAAPNYTARFQVSPYIATTTPPANNATVTIYERYSNVRLTGHDFLNIGFGNFINANYPNTPALPLTQANEVVEYGGGRVFYTSTDQDGNFRVGELFKVEQATGIATLNADAFNLSGLSSLQLGSVALGGSGVNVTEFSADPTFTANSDNILPTQRAVRSFVENLVGGGGSALVATSVELGDMFLTGNTIVSRNNKNLVLTAPAGYEVSFASNPSTALTPTTGNHLTNKTYVDSSARPTVHAIKWSQSTGEMSYVTETGSAVAGVLVNQQKLDSAFVSTTAASITINSSGHMIINL